MIYQALLMGSDRGLSINLGAAKKRVSNKSCLVSQNYSDQGSSAIVTKAPTIQRTTQRIFMYPVA